MRVICKLLGQGIRNKKYRPGDIIFAPWLRSNALLCPEFRATATRDPILVCLPNNRLFSPDLCGAYSSVGWRVDPDLTRLNISPTVVCVETTNSYYRIKNGVITDDAPAITKETVTAERPDVELEV
jgi:hypothetical protein